MNRRLFLSSLVLGPAALQIALKAKETPLGHVLRAGQTIEWDVVSLGNGLFVGVLPPIHYPPGRAPSVWGPEVRFPTRSQDYI